MVTQCANNLRDSSWNVHQGVELVEDRDEGCMSIEEEPLKVDFGDRKEDLEDGVVFEGKDIDAMLLSQLSHSIASIS